MKLFTTVLDAEYELELNSNYKTGTIRCNCGETYYYEKPIYGELFNKIIICDECYLDCANFERI
jgi:hypothetical protein